MAARRSRVGLPGHACPSAASRRPLRQPGRRKACPGAAPHTGAAFSLWHPTLRTMRVWLWAPNPHGLFTRTNPSFSYESPLALAFDADAEGR